MSENKCLECNTDLMELYTKEEQVSTDYLNPTYDIYPFYAYWCRFCEQMYVRHHKSWLERWEYQSCKESANNAE